MKKLLLLIIAVSIAAYAYFLDSKKNMPKQLTYLIATAPANKYCNGDKMDSAGYRKTITKLVTTEIATKALTKQQLINKIISLASGPDNKVVNSFKQDKQILIKLNGDTATISPIDGWAGISIFMCSWKPLVEVNLKRIPFVKHVVWN